jgi:hypothetical protein
MAPGQKWVVNDRYGHEIYLTEERWNHIVSRHEELSDLLDDLLETLRKGRRRQEPTDPSRYRYYWRCENLPAGFTHIVAAVVFKQVEQPDGEQVSNNFVTSAWGVLIYRET